MRKLGRVEEAIPYYESAMRIDPHRIAPAYAEALNDFGAALWRAGKPAEAMDCYRHALRVRPDFPEAHYNLAGACEQQGRTNEALAHYEQALRIRPDFPEARRRLAQLRSRLTPGE